MTSRRRGKDGTGRDEAEILALRALAFLGEEEGRIMRFLSATGLSPADLRAEAEARDARFLAGVLDHLLADEPLLLVFAAEAGIDPSAIAQGRAQLLPGEDGLS